MACCNIGGCRDGNNMRKRRGLVSGYYEVLTRWPGLVLGVVFIIFVCIFIVISFNMEHLKVTDASKGVEARETELSGRSFALNNLINYKNLSFVPKINGTESKPPLQVPTESTCEPANWFKMLKMIVEPVEEDGNLLDVDHIKSLCELEEKLTSHRHVDKKCGMVSILNVIRDVTGATCETIHSGHVAQINTAVATCMAHYVSGITAGQPDVCKTVFNVFFYFSDDSFSNGRNNVGNIYPLRRSLIMIQLNDSPSSAIARDYHADVLDRQSLVFRGLTRITGIDSAVKQEVFERYLFIDLGWMVMAFLLVGVVMMIYLRSIVMAIATAANIGLSLTIAYFFYLIVLRIQFFPFLNLLASVILIALAADDVFLFSETWQNMKKRFPSGSLEDNMTLTFRHAGMSVFVTSITTATSFFSNVVSNVTSIKCFGVFAGLCILANYFLMCTFIPAVMILLEKSNCTKCKWETPQCFVKIYNKIGQASDYVFGHVFFNLINKFYPLLILFFFAVGVGSAVVVYYKPKLSLPNDGRFKGFVSSHPLEVYDDQIGSFKFVQNGGFSMSLYYVWGVNPVDNGNPMNPDDKGKLDLDETFDLNGAANQAWLANLCMTLKNSSYIAATNETVCSLDQYLKSITEPCQNVGQACCGNRGIDFRKCYPLFMTQLYATTPLHNIAGLPFFDESNEVKAFVLNFTSTQGFVTDYDKMDKFYNNVSNHLASLLGTNAPSGSSEVFITSFFDFYDTQKALIRGTFVSVGISLGVTLACVLVTTRNLLVSLYSIVNIAQAIHVTVACLVLLGWTLNITESIVISLAVGLTIDFVIHFGVSYMLSFEMTREKRVHDVLTTVGSPAAMAAFTTFLAGAAMMPATVLSYQQLGIFLVFCMVISITYSLFFFLPLCRWIGPLGDMMQLSLPFCCKDDKDQTYSNDTSMTNSYNTSKTNSLEHSPKNSEKSSHNSSFNNIDSFLHGSKRSLLDQNLPSLANFRESSSHNHKNFYLSPDPLGSDKPYKPHRHPRHPERKDDISYISKPSSSSAYSSSKPSSSAYNARKSNSSSAHQYSRERSSAYKDSSSAYKGSKPSSSAYSDIKPSTAYSSRIEKSSAYKDRKNKSSAHSDRNDRSSGHNDRKDRSSAHNDRKDRSSAHNDRKDRSSAHNDRKDRSSAHNDRKDRSSAYNGSKDNSVYVVPVHGR